MRKKLDLSVLGIGVLRLVIMLGKSLPKIMLCVFL